MKVGTPQKAGADVYVSVLRKKQVRNKQFQVWTQNNHAEELLSNRFIDQKLDYIHENPVRAGIADEPEHYIYSSARDYAGEKGLLPFSLLK